VLRIERFVDSEVIDNTSPIDASQYVFFQILWGIAKQLNLKENRQIEFVKGEENRYF